MNMIHITVRALLLLTFFVGFTARAGHGDTDARVRAYPATFPDVASLAARINRDFPDESSKARAIFTWVATNVSYDMKAYSENERIAYSYTTEADRREKEKVFRDRLSRETIRSGKALCEGYSSLFVALCREVNLEAVIITGTSRTHQSQIGKMPAESDHAWNAVKIDGQWKLMDLAWAAGIVDQQKKFRRQFNDVYFATDPAKFACNHFPDDPKWLLTSRSAKEFAEAPFFYPAYLAGQLEFNIRTGYVTFRGNRPVSFQVRNLAPTDRVAYINSLDRVLDPVTVSDENTFSIPPSAKTSEFLTIFVNEKPVVSYKILRS